jgi:hypothetical protein
VHAHKNRHIDTVNSPAQDWTYEMAIELPRFGQVSLTRVKQAAHMKSRACATFGDRLTAGYQALVKMPQRKLYSGDG